MLAVGDAMTINPNLHADVFMLGFLSNVTFEANWTKSTQAEQLPLSRQECVTLAKIPNFII